MSRSELHGIVANLREYLEWHRDSEPNLGIPAASAELIEAFAARTQSREQARIEAARNAISGEPETSPTTEPAQQASKAFDAEPPHTRPKPTPEKPAHTESSPDASKPWVKYGPKSRKTFAAPKPAQAQNTKTAETAANDAADPPTAEYDGPPMESDGPDESYGDSEPNGPLEFDYPAHGAGNIKDFDATRFGWHAGKFRSPPQPAEGFESGDKLAILRMYLGDCTRCGLCEGRTNIVFGDGSPTARLMFIGEGPGYNEDQQARPFVGKAGQLLDKMIRAMGFGREEVYIANVVKCRPPDNRDPAPEEVTACSPFLHKQIAAIEPDVIVTLGRFAAHSLLGVDTPISGMRGQWHEFNGTPVMPTWHPAYLLRNDAEKGNAWNDLQAVMKRLAP